MEAIKLCILLQEMVSQPGISGVRAVASASAPTVVSVAGFTQAQVQAATQRLSVAATTATASAPKAVAASMVASGKTLTPQQLQQLQQRQQQALKRREQQLKVTVSVIKLAHSLLFC